MGVTFCTSQLYNIYIYIYIVYIFIYIRGLILMLIHDHDHVLCSSRSVHCCSFISYSHLSIA